MEVVNRQAQNELLDRIPSRAIIAIGSGAGMHHVFRSLAKLKGSIAGIISTSTWPEYRILQLGLIPIDSNETKKIDLFVDSAPEISKSFNLNKGKDPELSRGKYFAHCASEFISFGNQETCVEYLGNKPIAIEVLPFARSHVINYFENANIEVQWNSEYCTENGNPLLLVQNGNVPEPKMLEETLESIPGVVACSIYANTIPDTLIVSNGKLATVLTKPPRKKKKAIAPNNVVNIRSFLSTLAD